MACLAAGLEWGGDDYALVSDDAPPTAYSLYDAAKLEAPHLAAMLPELGPAVTTPGGPEGEKALIDPERLFPGRLLRSVAIRAVVLPAVTGGRRSRLVEVSPMAGISAIAPSTLFQLRWTVAEEYEAIAAAVRSVPNYRLELGTDLRRVGETVAALLAAA